MSIVVWGIIFFCLLCAACLIRATAPFDDEQGDSKRKEDFE